MTDHSVYAERMAYVQRRRGYPPAPIVRTVSTFPLPRRCPKCGYPVLLVGEGMFDDGHLHRGKPHKCP